MNLLKDVRQLVESPEDQSQKEMAWKKTHMTVPDCPSRAAGCHLWAPVPAPTQHDLISERP